MRFSLMIFGQVKLLLFLVDEKFLKRQISTKINHIINVFCFDYFFFACQSQR